jgi:hypothetical protein
MLTQRLEELEMDRERSSFRGTHHHRPAGAGVAPRRQNPQHGPGDVPGQFFPAMPRAVRYPQPHQPQGKQASGQLKRDY